MRVLGVMNAFVPSIHGVCMIAGELHCSAQMGISVNQIG